LGPFWAHGATMRNCFETWLNINKKNMVKHVQKCILITCLEKCKKNMVKHAQTSVLYLVYVNYMFGK
jgi:predicted Na+-dependent transporter